MAWTETCKIDFRKQIEHKKTQGMPVRQALKVLSEESGIAINTLSCWLYPREKQSVVNFHHTPTTQNDSVNSFIANNSQYTPVAEEVNENPYNDSIESAEIQTGKNTKIAHVSHNSGENEWYTPNEIIKSVYGVMGKIDLDPASCETANKVVQACKFYTKEDNGLHQEWFGRIFLNPPYSQPLIRQFSDKLCEVIDASEIKEAIVLVNNATETTWFQNMAQRASAICFVNKRIKFLNLEGRSGAPLQGQSILYFGENRGFIDIFQSIGVVLQHV
jgi:ParB family chromosome partitioning protein